MFPYGVTVTLRTRTRSGTDAYGNDTFTTADTAVDGCAFDPGSSSELVQGQDTTIRHPAVYLPVGVDAPAAIDEVIVAGVTYQVDGAPETYSNPFTGTVFGTVVRLEGVTG